MPSTLSRLIGDILDNVSPDEIVDTFDLDSTADLEAQLVEVLTEELNHGQRELDKCLAGLGKAKLRSILKALSVSCSATEVSDLVDAWIGHYQTSSLQPVIRPQALANMIYDLIHQLPESQDTRKPLAKLESLLRCMAFFYSHDILSSEESRSSKRWGVEGGERGRLEPGQLIDVLESASFKDLCEFLSLAETVSCEPYRATSSRKITLCNAEIKERLGKLAVMTANSTVGDGELTRQAVREAILSILQRWEVRTGSCIVPKGGIVMDIKRTIAAPVVCNCEDKRAVHITGYRCDLVLGDHVLVANGASGSFPAPRLHPIPVRESWGRFESYPQSQTTNMRAEAVEREPVLAPGGRVLRPRERAAPRGMLSVFISYAHEDALWMERVRTGLTVQQNLGMVHMYSDVLIESGQRWEEEIRYRLDTCDIAILIVSDNFCRSAFVKEKELPWLLDRNNPPVTILALRTSGKMILEPLKAIKFVHDMNHCLDDLTPIEQENALKELVVSLLMKYNRD